MQITWAARALLLCIICRRINSGFSHIVQVLGIQHLAEGQGEQHVSTCLPSMYAACNLSIVPTESFTSTFLWVCLLTTPSCSRRSAAQMAPSGKTSKARVLVLHTPDAPELKVLEKLPEGAHVIGIGRTLSDLEGLLFPTQPLQL